MEIAKKYFCGIDGGATHSTVVVLDCDGKKCTQIEGGPPLNHWLSGMDVCCQHISDLVLKAKSQVGIPHDVKFAGLVRTTCLSIHLLHNIVSPNKILYLFILLKYLYTVTQVLFQSFFINY